MLTGWDVWWCGPILSLIDGPENGLEWSRRASPELKAMRELSVRMNQPHSYIRWTRSGLRRGFVTKLHFRFPSIKKFVRQPFLAFFLEIN